MAKIKKPNIVRGKIYFHNQSCIDKQYVPFKNRLISVRITKQFATSYPTSLNQWKFYAWWYKYENSRFRTVEDLLFHRIVYKIFRSIHLPLVSYASLKHPVCMKIIKKIAFSAAILTQYDIFKISLRIRAFTNNHILLTHPAQFIF